MMILHSQVNDGFAQPSKIILLQSISLELAIKPMRDTARWTLNKSRDAADDSVTKSKFFQKMTFSSAKKTLDRLCSSLSLLPFITAVFSPQVCSQAGKIAEKCFEASTRVAHACIELITSCWCGNRCSRLVINNFTSYLFSWLRSCNCRCVATE